MSTLQKRPKNLRNQSKAETVLTKGKSDSKEKAEKYRNALENSRYLCVVELYNDMNKKPLRVMRRTER